MPINPFDQFDEKLSMPKGGTPNPFDQFDTKQLGSAQAIEEPVIQNTVAAYNGLQVTDKGLSTISDRAANIAVDRGIEDYQRNELAAKKPQPEEVQPDISKYPPQTQYRLRQFSAEQKAKRQQEQREIGRAHV